MILKLEIFRDSFSLSPASLSLSWSTPTMSVQWLETGEF